MIFIDIHWYTPVSYWFNMCSLLIYMSYVYSKHIYSQFRWIGVDNGPYHFMTTRRQKTQKVRIFEIIPNQARINLRRPKALKGIKGHPKGFKKTSKIYSRTLKMEEYFELNGRQSADGNLHVYWYTLIHIDIHQFCIDIHVFVIDIHEFCLL